MKKRVHQRISNLFRRIPFSRLLHHLYLDRGRVFAEMVAIDSRGRSECHPFYRMSRDGLKNVVRLSHFSPAEKLGFSKGSVTAHESPEGARLICPGTPI